MVNETKFWGQYSLFKMMTKSTNIKWYKCIRFTYLINTLKEQDYKPLCCCNSAHVKACVYISVLCLCASINSRIKFMNFLHWVWIQTDNSETSLYLLTINFIFFLLFILFFLFSLLFFFSLFAKKKKITPKFYLPTLPPARNIPL